MRILLFGGSGFVGHNVFEHLNSGIHEIFPLSTKDGLDLTDLGSTIKFIKEIKPNVIINCAAKVGSLNMVTQLAADILDINLRMLLNIFRAINEVDNKIVLINPIANCAYPGHLTFYQEDKLWEGKVHDSVYAYGNTRRMIEVFSRCYAMQYGLKTINFLLPNMYGPYDSTDPNKAHALNALVGKFIKAKHEDAKKIEIWGSGIAIREWLYAGDFGKVLSEAIERLNDYGFYEPINIGQNFGLSVKELTLLISETIGFGGEIVWNRAMPDGAARKVMDDTRFKKVFPGFSFMNFRKGIQNTIDYYQSVYPY
jgi:GDP-L-fucose synthase